jgi:hypothetical protein
LAASLGFQDLPLQWWLPCHSTRKFAFSWEWADISNCPTNQFVSRVLQLRERRP